MLNTRQVEAYKFFAINSLFKYNLGPLRNANPNTRLIIANVKHITKFAGISMIIGSIIEQSMRKNIDMPKHRMAL